MPAATWLTASRNAIPPGPWVRKMIGSGFGVAEAALAWATATRVLRPSGLSRFSRQVKLPPADCGPSLGGGPYLGDVRIRTRRRLVGIGRFLSLPGTGSDSGRGHQAQCGHSGE